MYRFENGNIISAPSYFIIECKMNIQNCSSRKQCHVRCHINCVQEFHLILYLNSHCFSLNNGKNTDSYIIKSPSLSRSKECDDKPEGTVFS